MNPYREMQVFLAVVQARSLAAAARQLQLSPASVMRSIAALERRLDSRLLLRGPRGVSPSAAGEGFAERCESILQRLAEAERSVSGLHANPAGHLQVALPLLMIHQVLTPIALGYLAAFPDVSLTTLAREELPRLVEEGVDLALVVGHLPSSSGFAVPLGQVRPLVCAAPDYLQRRGRPDTPQALHAHRIIATSSTGHVADWRFANQQTKLVPRLVCNTAQGAIRAAVAGFGLTRCLSYEVDQELRSGQLQTVLDDFAAAPLPVQLYYREGRRAAARVRSFLDFVVPRLRAHPAFRA